MLGELGCQPFSFKVSVLQVLQEKPSLVGNYENILPMPMFSTSTFTITDFNFKTSNFWN